MNNRQAGRRRGRGGQQRQGGNPNNQGNGNRIDNRARGNAAQLLEKYKNLARDAQMQGDRVNAEYYLQFADHYFRVLNENRSRFEDQNQQRRQRDEFEGDDEEFDAGAEGARDDAEEQESPRPPHREREARYMREPRDDRRNGRFHVPANGHGNDRAGPFEAEPQATPEIGEEAEVRAPRRRGRPRRDPAAEAEAEGAPGGIDVAVLPPAFGAEPGTAPTGEDEASKKPRRRRTTKNDEAEVPAA